MLADGFSKNVQVNFASQAGRSCSTIGTAMKYSKHILAILAVIPLTPLIPWAIIGIRVGYVEHNQAFILGLGGSLLYSAYWFLVFSRNRFLHDIVWVVSFVWNLTILASGIFPLVHRDIAESICGYLAIWVLILSVTFFIIRYLSYIKFKNHDQTKEGTYPDEGGDSE